MPRIVHNICTYWLFIVGEFNFVGAVNTCGILEIVQPAYIGRDVTLTFTPAVYDDNGRAEWQRRNDENPWSTLPNTTKFQQYVEDETYYLNISRTVIMQDDMFYRVNYLRIGVANCTGDSVKLDLQKVKPSQPQLEGLQDIGGCVQCLVGHSTESVSIVCRTRGGTEPVVVRMSIGNESMTVNRDATSDIYRGTYTRLRRRHHMSKIVCTANNDALESAIATTALMYVIKSPVLLPFHVPSELIEGNPVNITCTYARGRPYSNVTLEIADNSVSDTTPSDFFSATSSTYTVSVSLITFKRVWNHKNIVCCCSRDWYTKTCSTPSFVNYIFPPDQVAVLSMPITPYTEEKQSYQQKFKCVLRNANPTCKANWRASAGLIIEQRHLINTKNVKGGRDSWYEAIINVNKADIGREVVCTAECRQFNVTMNDTHIIQVPYADEIEFNTTGTTINIPKGGRVYVNCSANSYPPSNITWTEHSSTGTTEDAQCTDTPGCVIDIRTNDNTIRVFSCQARHQFGMKQKKLTVNVFEAQTCARNGSGSSKRDLYIYAGFTTIVCLTLIVVLAATYIKNRKARKEESRISTHMPSRGARTCMVDSSYTLSLTDSPVSLQLRDSILARRDPATDYVDIDVAKSALTQAAPEDDGEAENLYANQ